MRRLLLPPALAALTISTCIAQDGGPATPPADRGRPSVSAAQAGHVITLPQALALAVADHPDLTAGQRAVEATEAAISQAGARQNPVLDAEIEDTRRETRTSTLQLSQPIELGGKRSARVQAAERGRDLAVAELAARHAEIRSAVTGAFFDTLIAQERVRLAETALQIAQGGSTAAGKRVTAGKVSPVEETRAKVAEAGVRIELAQARSELRSSLLALHSAVGGKGPAFHRVEGSADVLPAEPADAALAARVADSPALRQARLEVDRLGALAQLERAKRIPDLTVGVGAKRSEELGRTQAILSLSMPLPVFDSNRGAEVEALRRQDQARAQAQATELRLRGEAMRALERLRNACDEAQALKTDVLPGAQSAYDAATKGFELGKFGFLDVLDAQRTLLQAKTQHLRALAETHRAAAELDRLLGIDGSTALAAVPTTP
jgi:cobalt-zinc-cadmium efflux system outer membrane protein